MADSLVQCLWIGPRLGNMEKMCLASFVQNGHRVRLFTYAPVENVPDGIEFAPAAEILPWSASFRTSDGAYANFADVFRYKLLAEQGGWWVDCDMLCLRPWPAAADTVVCSTDEYGHGRIANVFALRAPKGSALMRACFEACGQLGEERHIFAHTGPFLMNRIVRERGHESALATPETFAPVPWNAPQYFVVTRPFARHAFHLKNLIRRRHLVPRFTRQTIGVHLWSGMWRMSGLNPDAAVPPSSLYALFRKRHAAANQPND